MSEISLVSPCFALLNATLDSLHDVLDLLLLLAAATQLLQLLIRASIKLGSCSGRLL